MSLNYKEIIKGNKRQLAKAITLIESTKPSDQIKSQELLEKIIPYTGKSIRVGISGTPGVGKSTFIESIGLHIINQNKKVAILAIDPSSPISGGSIMGDKTRMEALSKNDNAFIRPSPTSGSLGGIAKRTRESILLCEAAGYDTIIIETVGVGQSEYEVETMTDFFLVLILPNSGDELQGIKKGIMELADAVIINKDDGNNKNVAKLTKQHYANALHLLSPKSFWSPKVLTCSSIENKNIDKIYEMIKKYEQQAKNCKFFEEKREKQNLNWMKKLINQYINEYLHKNSKTSNYLKQLELDVKSGKTTASKAARFIIDKIGLK